MNKPKPIQGVLLFLMRVTLIQLMISSASLMIGYAVDTRGQEVLDKKITIEAEQKEIKQILSTIEREANVKFTYRSRLIQATKKVSLRAYDSKLVDVLTTLFGEGINLSVIGKQIVLKPAAITAPEIEENNQAGDIELLAIKVSGQVVDDTGQPLPGVNIVIKGTTQGTTTDSDGRYAIDAPNEDAILVFSFIGYAPQEVRIGAQTVIDVKMVSDLTSLNEIVIVGYGEQEKLVTTAAISTVKGQDFAQKPVVNLTNNLIGRTAGVIADQGSGEPGLDGARIRIRGASTTGNANPLLVVDGIYRDFSRLDPNSIESITVLKDAAAVAPYGLAGANGVILVTTKKGKSGAPKFAYNNYFGFQNPTRLPRMVNSYQFALLKNEANMNSGLNPAFTDEEIAQYKKTVDGAPDADPDRYPNSKGLRDILQHNTLVTNHNLQLSGGTEKMRYFTSLAYTYQAGQFSTTYLKKYNAMINLEVDATKTTKVALAVNGWVEDQHFAGGRANLSGGDDSFASANGGILYQAFRTPPTSPIYYSNGLWGSYIGHSLVGFVEHSGYVRNEDTQLLTTFSIEQQLPFIKGLSIKGLVSYDPSSSYSKLWQVPVPSYSVDFSTTPYSYTEGFTELTKPQLTVLANQNKAFTYQGYLNYHKTFGNHDVTFLGVVESRNQKYWNIRADRNNYPIAIDELDRGGTDKQPVPSGSSSEQAQVGYVYRLSYNYSQKYLVEISGRYDGHYYFAPGKKYGFFPAFSVGWNLSEEDFVRNSFSSLDALKLRASYGESGNLAGGPFQYLSGYSIYSNAAFFRGAPSTGIAESQQGNAQITWEVARKYDIGVEASLWSGRLTFEADYFYEKRSNMLTTPLVIVPGEYGVGLSEVNGGVMSNRGIELSIGSEYQFSNGIKVSLTGNFTHARNKLIQVYETDATYDNPNRRRTGRPNGTQFGLHALGYFTPNDFNPDGSLKTGVASIPLANVQPGDLKYKDLSGPDGVPDGIIDVNDETVIGHPNGTPQIIYGITPAVSWKGIDLSMLFQGASQISLPVGGSLVQPFDQEGSASELSYKDHWTPVNTNALYPRVYASQPGHNTRFSSWWVRDASYLKLRSMEIGYTFPTAWVNRAGMQSLRVFSSGQNLFTWTPHMKEKLDPEARSSNGQYYYQQRVLSFGLNATF
jgi:TonB-linked SusC/RagA family outer membrane protein